MKEAVRSRSKGRDGSGAENRLFIGGLNYTTSANDLREFVEAEGFEVLDAHVVLDKVTGQSRGFGFVSLSGDEDQQAAIMVLAGKRCAGRELTVNKALPRPDKGLDKGKDSKDNIRVGR